MALKNLANKEALIWLSEKLREFEEDNVHAELNIKVVCGSATHYEIINKGLFRQK